MENKLKPSYWNLTIAEALKQYKTKSEGLDSDEASKRLVEFGYNSLKGKSTNSAFLLFLAQFRSPITLLLIIAAILSFVLKDTTDATIILIIILISGVLGFWQERGTANAVEQLLKIVQIKCRAIRDGKEIDLPTENIVPGDIILLAAGDIISGDSLIIDSKELFVDEAAFTGESYPVEKNAGKLPFETPLANRTNSLLMGSHVISGKAKAMVTGTARQTEFGKISDRLRLKSPETDFERGIRQFGYLLMEITMILVVLIFAINVFQHKPIIDSFLFSLALAVGLTPQLLPAIIAVNLAAGARNMAKKKVIVKRLSAIENFGSMNILCSDKTGTITSGKVMVKNTLSVSGKTSERVLHFAWLNASLQLGFKNPIDEAIIAFKPDGIMDYTVQSEVPYDFIRKRLSIQVYNNSENIAITKGAINQVIEVCTFVETDDSKIVPIAEQKDEILKLYEKLSEEGFRTLGLAWKKCDASKDFTRDDEKEMIFSGFITLFDPPKEGVTETIMKLNELGVSLKIITGDNALVAKSLSFQLGLPDPVILTGPEIGKMNDSALIHKVSAVHIFAEVEPNQKERIIQSLKKGGYVVGFMGDGINDASAIHAADVGISVDTAVDVAKEAAEIVLLDHDLRVLLQGITEGRRTFANTMKYVLMATSANFGNMFSMAGASLFLPFLPLLPKQILLTNLMTDFPETTISSDRVDDISINKPHRWDIGFIKRFMITFGILSSIFDFLTFGVLLYFLKANETLFQTGWFTESVISASMIVLVVRTRLPFFKSLPGRYLAISTIIVALVVLILPFTSLGVAFDFVKLPLAFYGWMLLIVALYIISAELTKRWFYKKEKN
ncbi:MAG: magnesium-translocating P-type ATPase [Dysgonamonadaceae bacterium]